MVNAGEALRIGLVNKIAYDPITHALHHIRGIHDKFSVET